MSTTANASEPPPAPAGGEGNAATEPAPGEAEQAESDLMIPEQVKAFFKELYNALLIEDDADMTQAYEVTWPRLTSTYYQQAPWPSPKAVSELVENDTTFLSLYRDLCLRHMFARLQPTMPTLQQRVDAWDNYLFLFDGLLGKNSEIDLRALPNSWTFDLLHEFVYQYQSFSQYRCKWQSRTDEEKAVLREKREAWGTAAVLTYLSRFVEKSNIVAILSEAAAGGGGGAAAPTPLLRQLGYFSLVMLSRVHTLLGDYHSALEVISPIFAAEGDGTREDKPTGAFARVPVCFVTLYFHRGFAQLMARRYADAVGSFQSALLFIFRRRLSVRGGDQMQKWADKLLALLAVVTALCPGSRLEEQVKAKLQEKYGEKVRRMALGEESSFEDVFSYACPKFILASPPPMDEGALPTNLALDAHQVQLGVFMQEVKQQLPLPTIKSYLKLYRSIGVDKLARFNDVDDATLRAQLLSLKHKTTQSRCGADDTSLLAGDRANASDLHFYVADDMAHVEQQREEQLFGQFFVTHAQKLHEVVQDVAVLPKPSPKAAADASE